MTLEVAESPQSHTYRAESIENSTLQEIVGTSPAIRLLRDEILRIAPYSVNVLITGETGTGKEIIARTIHKLSPRRLKAFVPVDCAAVTGGYRAGGNGAFTYGRTGLRPKDVLDGLSKTVFFSERTKGGGRPLGEEPDHRTRYSIVGLGSGNNVAAIEVDSLFENCQNFAGDGFGAFDGAGRWMSGDDWSNGWPFAGYDATQYNHVAPPNWSGRDCGTNSYIPDTAFEHAVIAARSEHNGVVVTAFGDGHSEIVSNDIDLLAWRALGSRDGKESIDTGL